MIEAIKAQANFLEDRLWDVAIYCYGLARTSETVEAIEKAALCAQDLFNENETFCGSSGDPVDSGLAACFMYVAVVKFENDPFEALDSLVFAAESVGRMCVIGGLRTQQAGTGAGLLGISLGRSLSHEGFSKTCASLMATKRHAEDRQLFSEALKYWRENIDFNLSAQKAATELTQIVPLSHKKLAEIVSAEKNKVSRLRKTEP